MPDTESLSKQAAIQVGAGGFAGFIEICIMYPLDLVKTRLQLQATKPKGLGASDPHYYTSIADCYRKMYKFEGLASFWKGILPPILVETPARATKFVTYEQFKRFFMFGSPTPTTLTFALAGFAGGVAEGAIVNPFEVVKVTLQSNKQLAAQMPSTWAVTRLIIREHGLGSRGLTKGLFATVARNAIFNMVYFGIYHGSKDYVPENPDPLLEFGRKLTVGFTAGVLASCTNIPFDVAKSRIQGPQPTAGVIKYKSTFGTIALVYREEGFLALYKGLVPKVMRLGPGGAIVIVMYDYIIEYLEDKKSK